MRTAFGAAFLTWVVIVFFAGSMDRAYLFLGWSYQVQVWAYRAALVVAPPVVFFLTRRVCRELVERERIEDDRHAAEHEARVAPA
jgi:ubiquinol-cytochrome c reductase cytochrome b subunit